LFIILGPEADSEIGSPTKMADFSEKMQARKDLPGFFTLSKEVYKYFFLFSLTHFYLIFNIYL
jgi:hypothetical protein